MPYFPREGTPGSSGDGGNLFHASFRGETQRGSERDDSHKVTPRYFLDIANYISAVITIYIYIHEPGYRYKPLQVSLQISF